MSELVAEFLSRDELDAILAAADSDAAGGADAGLFGAGDGELRGIGALTRAFEEFGEEQGRQLSTQFQRAIRFELTSVEALSSKEFAGCMMERDHVVLVEMSPDDVRGALLVGRTLFFSWMAMALGGRPGGPCDVPDRANSRIERRFLRLFANELLRLVERSIAQVRPVGLSAGDVLEPGDIGAVTEARLCVASFDASGFGDVARLRIALPVSWVDCREAGEVPAERREPDSGLRSAVGRMPLSVRAEVGVAEVSLKEIAAFQPGDTIPLEPVAGGQVLVRVGDAAKFVAVPGSVGSRLAVRIVDEV